MSDSIELRAARWACGNDTGASSTTLCLYMLGMPPTRPWYDYPHDPDDLGRCLRLLETIPEWKSRIGEMAECGPYWAALASDWERVADEMAEEVGIDWSKGRSAPRAYALMRSVLEPVERADNSVISFGDAMIRGAATP